MKSLERRPLGVFASVFYVSSCIFFSVPEGMRMWCGIVLFALLAAVLLCGKRIPYRRTAAAVAVALAASSIYAGFVLDVGLARVESLSGKKADVTATVTDVRYASSWRGCYNAEIDGMNVVLYSDNCELAPGDVIKCSVVYDTVDGARDSRRYMLSDNILLTAETEGVVSVCGYSDPGILYRLREALSSRFAAEMGDEAGGFAASLLLGDRSHLEDHVTRDFRALGISHVLALSGTHLTVLFSFAGAGIFVKRRLLRFFILCPLVPAYAVLTGMPASVMRAGIMMILAAASGAANKKPDSFTSLSVSAVIICFINPFAPYDVGLRLSFACVLGIMLAVRMSRRLTEGKGRSITFLINVAVAAVVVPLVTLPVMWLTFGEVSLVSPIFNILLVPVASLLLIVFAVLAAVSWIAVLYVPLAAAAGAVTELFLKLVRWVAESHDPVVSPVGILPYVLIFVFAACVVTAVFSCGRLRKCAASAGICFICIAIVVSQGMVCFGNMTLTVYFASEGSGDAMCITSEGYSILVDMGDYPVSSRSAAELAGSSGVGRIDALVIPDVEKTHILVLSELTGNNFIDSLWLPCDSENTPMLADAARSAGIDVILYVPGERLCFGNAELTAFCTGSGDSAVVHCTVERSGRTVEYSSDSGIAADGAVCVTPCRVAESMPCVSDSDAVADTAVIKVTADGVRRIRG